MDSGGRTVETLNMPVRDTGLENQRLFGGAFAGQTVLVTGHTGFKGAWLALWLRRLGARVVGYALAPPTDPSLFVLAGLAGEVAHIVNDIRDQAALEEVLREHQPTFIFHLAAQSLVRKSYRAPAETFDVNVMGTVALLEAVREARISCAIVAVTTDKCYLNREWVHGYRETDPLGGHDPYSASKAAAEIAIAAYRLSFFPPEQVAHHRVRLASARAGNVFGGGDWSADRIMPDAMRAFARGNTLAVRHPTAVRPWQHVLEPLSGYLWLAVRLAAAGGERLAEGWNFGPLPTELRTVGELADAAAAAWGDATWFTPDAAEQPHEASVLRLSIDKASAQLGWEPVWDFATAVARTVGWYRRAADGDAACAACRDDIAAYEAAARVRGARWAR